MKDTIRSGYGWITPTGTCLNVQDPSQLTPAILANCRGIQQMYNITTERDDRFYLGLFNYAYKQGYLRVSKHQHTLAVEGYSADLITPHTTLINRVASELRYKGKPLQVKRFITSDMIEAHLHPVRNQMFPRQ